MSDNNTFDQNLVSYCGFFCGACPKFNKGECRGCKGDNPLCAVGYRKCTVRPCCIENNYSSCAECTLYKSVKDCVKFNPWEIKLGQFITRTKRRKGIEFIKEKGEAAFIDFMKDRNWVSYKLGKKFKK